LKKLMVLLATTMTAAAALWLTMPATPPPFHVNGRYRNSYCEAVILQDGVLITSRQEVTFKLQLLKFGLIANLKMPIEVRDGRVVASPNASTMVLGFSEDLKALTICGQEHCRPGREFQFVRTKTTAIRSQIDALRQDCKGFSPPDSGQKPPQFRSLNG
jgi:hypothetical protein